MTRDEKGGEDALPVPPAWRQEIDAYIDGLLDDDPARQKAVADFLAERPALKARAEAQRERNQELRDALDPVMAAPVPNALYAALEQDDAPGWARGVRNAAAVVALALVSGVTGWWLGQTPQSGAPETVAEVMEPEELTARTALESVSEPQERAALQAVSLDEAVPDLQSLGLKETDRQLITTAERPTLRVRYATTGGQAIDLLVQERRLSSRPRFMEDEDRAAAVWTDSAHVYALVTRGRSEELRQLTERVRAAIGERNAPFAETLSEIPELSDQVTAAPRSPERGGQEARNSLNPGLIVPASPDTAAKDL